MSDVITSSNRNDMELVSRLERLYNIAKQEKRNYYDTWSRNYRLINNKVSQGPNSGGPKDSEIYPICANVIGWVTDQRTNVDVVAASDPYTESFDRFSEVANDCNTLVESIWDTYHFDQQIKLCMWDVMPYGIAFLKSVWDQSLDDGNGQAVMRRVDPWSMYWDPNATSDEDCEYFVEVRRMSLNEIERRWPGTSIYLEAAGGDSDENPNPKTTSNNAPKANPGPLSGKATVWGGAKSSFSGYQPLPAINVYEFWCKENDEFTKDITRHTDDGDDTQEEKIVTERWRCIVIANRQVLMDEYADEFYPNGNQPYTRFVMEDLGEFVGVALVDHLASPQIHINRLLNSLQQNAELIGNPVFVEGSNSGLDRVSIINQPGQRLRLKGTGAMQNKPEWLTPPNMPTGVKDLIEFWIQRMENIAGISALSKGQTSVGRTTESVMSSVQEAGFVRIRSMLRNLEVTLTKATGKLIDLIIENYTEPRFIAVLGQDGARKAKVFNSRHFMADDKNGEPLPLKYSLNVQAGASMPTSRQARIAEADKAYTLGIIDRQAWFEAHMWPNFQVILKRVDDKIAKGQFQPPGARQKAGRSK